MNAVIRDEYDAATPRSLLPLSAAEIEQRAAEWLVKIDADGTPESWRRLDAWLAANPRNRAAFLRLSVSWRCADALRRLATPDQPADEDLLSPERPPADEGSKASAEFQQPEVQLSKATRTLSFGIGGIAAILGSALGAFDITSKVLAALEHQAFEQYSLSGATANAIEVLLLILFALSGG